ncbi:Type II secretion system protein F [Hydrogenovibrio crunogenus]|uniref:General secretion pathway protein F n=2 Tax=Hydrogenovibrio crunogenus TaxID=39765 RepID=A0A4P7NYE2_9GAMM|nr:Type II secretion system protein F [Hydrogenovibrio crunogenus]
MRNYRYRGISQTGKRVQGEMQASNEQDLEQRLRAINIDLLTFKNKPYKGDRLFKRSKVTRRDIIVVTSQLRQLLKAGVPLMDILDDLRRTYENEAVCEILSSIYKSMEGGESFSLALKNYEAVFGKVYISLVAVGEKTGQLDQVLENLEHTMKWEESLASKAKKVMIYPAIVATVVLAVVVLLMIFVVPELLSFIKEMDGSLGFATVSLIATSHFIREYLIFISLFLAATFYLLKWWLKKSHAFRVKFDRFIFKIYIFGPILLKLKIARFASTLSIMYGAGINFNDSLKLASMVTGNAYLEERVSESRHLIEEGETIYKAFDLSGLLPPLAVRMVKVGEQSGNMDEALRNVSEYYDTEAKDLIEKIEPAIEPILTVVMALMVGWVMMAVLGPVYETISKVP